jgi:hypothetical protein
MGRQLDYDAARELLKNGFDAAERAYATQKTLPVWLTLIKPTDLLFSSSTQAFREAFVGCLLARILDHRINIRLPYMNQGDDAFNGRTLDERVVNPFLRDKSVPCSTGPYLSALRRNVQFNEDTAKGIRDKQAYFALLSVLSDLETTDKEVSEEYLVYLLYQFVALRDSAQITLSKIKRFRLDQHESLVQSLLQTPSGGLLPVLLSAAMFQTIQGCFSLPWEIEWQGINVADRASGVAGDITVKRDGQVVLAVEVTERPIRRDRVVSTFNTKIAPFGLDDYLFFFTAAPPTEDARATARQYFAQGHDINFVPIKDWIMTTLTTIGPSCRSMFTEALVKLLSSESVPATLKVAWNDYVQKLSLGG